MARFSKADISEHRSGYTSNGTPAINVKCYHFGDERDSEGRSGAERLAAETGLPLKRCEHLFELAWEWQVSDFWSRADETVQECLGKAFARAGRKLTTYSEGRSGGWLCVGYAAIEGRQGPFNDLPDLESWDAVKVSAWGNFERVIAAEMAYFASYEAIKETLDCNGLLNPEAERLEAKHAAERIAKPFGFAVVEAPIDSDQWEPDPIEHGFAPDLIEGYS